MQKVYEKREEKRKEQNMNCYYCGDKVNLSEHHVRQEFEGGIHVMHQKCFANNLQPFGLGGITGKAESSKSQSTHKSQFLNSILVSQERQYRLVEKKNNDYSRGEDEYRNFRMVNHVMPWISVEEGIIIRMLDKITRLANLAHYKSQYVTDESFTDTCDDIANYSNILIAYRGFNITAEEAKEQIEEIQKQRAYREAALQQGAIYAAKQREDL